MYNKFPALIGFIYTSISFFLSANPSMANISEEVLGFAQ